MNFDLLYQLSQEYLLNYDKIKVQLYIFLLVASGGLFLYVHSLMWNKDLSESINP